MRLYELLNKNNIKIDKDIFDYGLVILKNYLIVLSISLISSIFLQTTFEMIFFFFSFLSLRRYWGGFHFHNSLFCNIFSTLILIFLPYYTKFYFILNWRILLIVNCFSTILFFIIGPIDHPNKRISKNEERIFKQKGFMTIAILLIIEITCKILEIDIVSESIFIALLCTLISLIAAILKNIIIKL